MHKCSHIRKTTKLVYFCPLCSLSLHFRFLVSHIEKCNCTCWCHRLVQRWTTSMVLMTSDAYRLCPLVKQIIYRNQKSIDGTMMVLQEIFWIVVHFRNANVFFFSFSFSFSFMFCVFCALINLFFSRLTVHLVIYHYYLPAVWQSQTHFLIGNTKCVIHLFTRDDSQIKNIKYAITFPNESLYKQQKQSTMTCEKIRSSEKKRRRKKHKHSNTKLIFNTYKVCQ